MLEEWCSEPPNAQCMTREQPRCLHFAAHRNGNHSDRELVQSVHFPGFEGGSTEIMFSCENALKTEALKAAMPHISMYGLYKTEIKLTQYESDTTQLKLTC